MISDADVATMLGLAERLARMPLACHRDPERPHAERDAIVTAFRGLVYDLRRRAPAPVRGPLPPGRPVVVGGRLIPVLTRRRP